MQKIPPKVDVQAENHERALTYVTAARKCNEAAELLTQAAELLEKGDSHAAFAEYKKSREIIDHLFPTEIVLPRRPMPTAKDKVVENIKEGFNFTRLVIPGLLLLALLFYLVTSGTTGNIAREYGTMSTEDAAKATAYPKAPKN